MSRLRIATGLVVAAFFVSAPVAAAPPGSGNAFNFRIGGFFPSGGGEFWETNEAAFTIDHSDLNGFIGGVGYAAAMNNYVDLGFNVDFYGASTQSADRFFNDQFGNPIFHDTRLFEMPLTVDVKFMPAGRFARRGPDGGRYVRRPVPYLGGGIGALYWEYEEEGDFVASDLSVIYDRYKASGTAFETHAFVGIEFPMSPVWNLTLEGRYSWADSDVGGVFETINPGRLELGGASFYVGGSWRF